MTRHLVIPLALAALLATVPAQAATICIVDFQQAVNETDEGKAAHTRLDTRYESKKNEIEEMRQSMIHGPLTRNSVVVRLPDPWNSATRFSAPAVLAANIVNAARIVNLI